MTNCDVKNAGPWNKGKLIGQKLPLKLKEIWAIRVLRGSDLVKIKVSDISNAGAVMSRAMVMQQKTGRPVQFEITESTREAISNWVACKGLTTSDFLFPSRVAASPHISTRQYARIVENWVKDVGLDSALYGTHTLRRTKPTLIYKRTHNLRAVQLLLGHTKLESTVRYLGIEVDDALEIAEQTEI